MNANSYSSPGTAGGNREDLRDVLTILEPEDTPFVSMVKKGPSPAATYVEVLADTLRKARTSGTPEGQDAGAGGNKAKDRKRFGTTLHRSMDEYSVTDVQQAVSKAGGVAAVTNEYDNSRAKTIREVKRDIEAVCCGVQEMQPSAAEEEMKTRGVVKWLSVTPQTVHPVPDAFRPPAASVLSGVTVVTEDQMAAVVQSIKRQYGAKRTYQAFSGDAVVNAFDNFTRVQPNSTSQRYQVNEDASKHEITMMVKVFETSHARLEIIPSQFLAVNAAGDDDVYRQLILNMELWELQYLEGLHSMDLDDKGGGPRGFVKTIFGLLCKNPKGNGMIYNT